MRAHPLTRLLLAATLLSPAARAADLVVHTGDRTAALDQVAHATQRPTEELEAHTLTEALASAPALAGHDLGLSVCLGEPTLTDADVAAALGRAQDALLYVEFDTAARELTSAIEGAACLKEPLDPALATRAWFLRGYLAYETGDEEAAWNGFLHAHRLQPGLEWDPNLTPRAMATFEAARADARLSVKVPLAIAPPPAPGTLWVDGRQADPSGLALTPGVHLVQVFAERPTGALVEVSAHTPAMLVFTQGLSDGDLAALAGSAHGSPVAVALGSVLPPGALVYASVGGEVWATTAGSQNWATVSRRQSHSTTGRVLTWSGATLAVGGGGLAAVSWYQARQATADALKPGKYKAALRRFDAASVRYTAGVAVAGVGAVALGAGILLQSHQAPFGLVPVPGGVLLTVRR